MSFNQAYIIVLEYLKQQSSEKEMVDFLDDVINGLKDKSHVEEKDHPKRKSIIKWGYNIFPFDDATYIKLAKEVENE